MINLANRKDDTIPGQDNYNKLPIIAYYYDQVNITLRLYSDKTLNILDPN